MAKSLRLVGLAEVAAMLGVTKRTALRNSRRADFPAPLAELAMGPVWDADDVEEWDDRRPSVRPGRRPGQKASRPQST
jgi:predicted DNA-binding transcriptional regulator AlpA